MGRGDWRETGGETGRGRGDWRDKVERTCNQRFSLSKISDIMDYMVRKEGERDGHDRAWYISDYMVGGEEAGREGMEKRERRQGEKAGRGGRDGKERREGREMVKKK